MKTLAILLMPLLAACGAVYRVNLTKPDGTAFTAEARSFTSSDAVSLVMERDKATGDVTALRFEKRGTEVMSQVQGDVLRSLVSLIPAGVPK